MKTVIVALTRKGAMVADSIRNQLSSSLYLPERFWKELPGALPISGSLTQCVGKLFQEYEGIIFVSALGIAVRSVAPYIESKWCDPAVVVVDEQRQFAVSLLSGHWGGGNDLARLVARILRATPVITTASDLRGVKTPEMIAKELGFLVENRENLPCLSALCLEGESVVYMTDDETLKDRFPKDVVWVREIPPEAKGVILVTDKVVTFPTLPFLVLRPRRMVLGVGMRQGVVFSTLLSLVTDFLTEYGVAPAGVGVLASVERKCRESALWELASYLGVSLRFFSVAELKQVASRFPQSPRVERVLGVGSVARPSGYLASGGGNEVGYRCGEGVTLSLFRKVD